MPLLQQADLPENKAKTVHPELVKFQLEKKAKCVSDRLSLMVCVKQPSMSPRCTMMSHLLESISLLHVT